MTSNMPIEYGVVSYNASDTSEPPQESVEVPSFDPDIPFEQQFHSNRVGVVNDVIKGLICPDCQSIRVLLYRETKRHGFDKKIPAYWYCPKCDTMEPIGQFLQFNVETAGVRMQDCYADTIVKLLIETGRYKKDKKELENTVGRRILEF